MKRRPRRAQEARSAKPIREPYARVLIVCEGSKTEPIYLQDLKQHFRIATANIEIVGGDTCGSSPATLVEYAVAHSAEDGDFDFVFCVFDRDTHPDYEAARDRCRTLRPARKNGEEVVFCAITSNPSFEFWLILHFVETSRPYLAAGSKSSGARVLADLMGHFAAYKKGSRGVFNALLPSLPLARERAKRVNLLGNENPHTRIVDLVGYLEEIRNGHRPVVT